MTDVRAVKSTVPVYFFAACIRSGSRFGDAVSQCADTQYPATACNRPVIFQLGASMKNTDIVRPGPGQPIYDVAFAVIAGIPGRCHHDTQRWVWVPGNGHLVQVTVDRSQTKVPPGPIEDASSPAVSPGHRNAHCTRAR